MKKRGMYKNKLGQEVMGMPFSTIFSIFLIIIFLFVAFYAISKFLDWKSCSEAGLFKEGLQDNIDNAWRSESSSKDFSGTMPSGVEYVCFADLSLEATGTAKEKEIYESLMENKNNNLFFYPRGKTCMPSVRIEHVNFTTNPYCFEVTQSKVKIKLEGIEGSPVRVSRS